MGATTYSASSLLERRGTLVVSNARHGQFYHVLVRMTTKNGDGSKPQMCRARPAFRRPGLLERGVFVTTRSMSVHYHLTCHDCVFCSEVSRLLACGLTTSRERKARRQLRQPRHCASVGSVGSVPVTTTFKNLALVRTDIYYADLLTARWAA